MSRDSGKKKTARRRSLCSSDRAGVIRLRSSWSLDARVRELNVISAANKRAAVASSYVFRVPPEHLEKLYTDGEMFSFVAFDLEKRVKALQDAA